MVGLLTRAGLDSARQQRGAQESGSAKHAAQTTDT